MAVLLVEVPVVDGTSLLVEMDRSEIAAAEGLTLATPKPGEAVVRASESLGESLERLKPVLAALREKLAAASPDRCIVEFGVKLGGETGIILAKGTAEVSFKVTMTWDGDKAGSGPQQ